MNDYVNAYAAVNPEQAEATIQEEFFEPALFQDVMDMKSIPQVSEKTASDLKTLQDEVYRSLFNLFQKTRGITIHEKNDSEEMFNIFELFFKSYYQHFRVAMDEMLTNKSPLKVAYYLGKNSDKLLVMMEQFIHEIEQELA